MVEKLAKLVAASKSLLTGMRLTIKRVNMPEVTLRYPFEKPQLSECFRGAPMIKGVMGEAEENETYPNRLGAFNSTIEDRHESGKLPACVYSCPAHVDARGYVELIAQGRFKDSLDLIRERCTLPAAIGRVCTRPCETGCRRNFFHEPISIRDLKRFAADACMALPHPEPVPITSSKRVAILGAGPAGLTAAQVLAKR